MSSITHTNFKTNWESREECLNPNPFIKPRETKETKQTTKPNIRENADNNEKSLVKGTPSVFTLDERNLLVDFTRAGFYPV